MIKKVMKNCLLIGSILLTIVLVSQIWFNSYFLPGGYGFFLSGLQRTFINPVMDFFGRGGRDTFSHNLESLFKPEKIVVNASDNRRMYTEGQTSYHEMLALSSEVLRNVLTDSYELKTKTLVDMDAYTSALKGKSIYIDYGKVCDFRLFSFSVCGKSQNSFSNDLSAVSSYIISLQDGIMNDISVYMMDQKSENIYRYIVEADKAEIDGQIQAAMNETTSKGVLSYSFELNFHKEQEGTPSKILFDPMILLDLTPVQLSEVYSRRLETHDEGLSEERINAILRTFSINSRSMWRYTDLTNARVFVENNATLTLYPEGLIEYQTVGNGRGLDISNGQTGYDIYAATDYAMDFVTQLCSHLPAEFFENLRIRTDMVEHADKQGVYQIYFDYCVDGVPVRHQAGDGYKHSVEMEIDNGYLKSYRQYLRAYDKTINTYPAVLPVLSAADLLVDSLYTEPDPVKVQHIQLCYVEDEFGAIIPKWNALVDGQEHIVQ